MDPIVEITTLNLEGIESGGNDSFSNDSVTGNNTTVISVTMGTNDEKNLIGDGGIDCKTRIKRHTEKENEISTDDQVRKKTSAPLEGFSLINSRHSFSLLEKESHDRKESEIKRHLTAEIGNGSFVASAMETLRLPPLPPRAEQFQEKLSKFSSGFTFNAEILKENHSLTSPRNTIKELKRQNYRLTEALMKTQKIHASEKKRFHEILFGIDKALSSLPIRLEKIRVRNQRNLSIIGSSRFHSGDGNDNSGEQSACESSPSDESVTPASRDSQSYVSCRMKCLLQKMDQLNELIHTIQEGDSSPIELLVNSELYAISLLKREIKSTKKQIEDNKTDTETVTSCEESHGDLAEDSSSKAKNSFSNELNKASNFKIFENHMMLQEEALNLLTRKIKETEEALLKESEAKEGLKRENEAMAKEIFRLKSTGEESKGEKSQKTEKLKFEAETTGSRPYRLIKELKTKLEEKEKSLVAWKSKYSRLEAVSSNKATLLESEKKKNFELESALKNAKAQNKSMSTHISSLQFLNDQLRDQMEILKHQVEILANKKLEREMYSATRSSKIDEQMSDLNEVIKTQEEKIQKLKEEGEIKMQEMEKYYERELKELACQLKKHRKKNESFADAFKELLVTINNFGMERDIKSIRNPSYNRIREILHITPSDLELLFSVYAKSSAEKEVERLCQEFKSIVDGEDEEFSDTLSAWLFNVITSKLFQRGCSEKSDDFTEL